MKWSQKLALFFASAVLGGSLVLFCASLTGCATTGTSGTIDVSQQSYNNRAAQLIQGVTAVRRASTSLLRAGKITVAEDESLQSQLDALHAAIEVGKAMYLTDPAAAQAKIDSAAEQLKQLKANTGVPQ